MHKLNVKMIVSRNEDGTIDEFFVQTVSRMEQSNIEPCGFGEITSTNSGAAIQVFVRTTRAKKRIIETPIVHQFTVAGSFLTEEDPLLEVELVDQDTSASIRKRIVHRDDSDEDQMPGPDIN